MMIPMLATVYWKGAIPRGFETVINTATLGGTIIGQLVFGILADRYGRKRMYGYELLILIAGTIAHAISGTGASFSMDIKPQLAIFRFIMGIGIGGDLSLSPV